MAVTDAWTNPVEGGAMDLDVGSVFTDAVYDAHCSDLLYLGGTDGKRGKNRTVWAQANYAGGTGIVFPDQYGFWASAQLVDAQINYVSCVVPVPADFSALVAVGSLIIPLASGNVYCRHTVHYAAIGEAYNTHEAIPAYAAVAATVSQLLFISAAAEVASLAAGDYLGIRFSRDATNVLDTCAASVHYIGAILTYTTI